VTFTGEILDINVQTLTVAGTFAIASSASVGFTFQFAINIIVQAGGIFQDQTTAHQLFFLAGSLCTFYPGTSFFGGSTVVFTYQTLPATGSLGANYTFGSFLSGPFTFGILLDGSILTFAEVTFIVEQSGDFTGNSSWLGGSVPTNDVCSLFGGCNLYIGTGFNLSTASLNGQLDVNLKEITVANGGVFELGAAGFNISFKFLFTVVLDCYGYLVDVSSGDSGIYLPFGSDFNLYAGGFFISQVSTFLYAYNTTSGETSGAPVSLPISLSGPYTVEISTSGEISVNANGKIFHVY
jgi:hypothetical protein